MVQTCRQKPMHACRSKTGAAATRSARTSTRWIWEAAGWRPHHCNGTRCRRHTLLHKGRTARTPMLSPTTPTAILMRCGQASTRGLHACAPAIPRGHDPNDQMHAVLLLGPSHARLFGYTQHSYPVENAHSRHSVHYRSCCQVQDHTLGGAYSRHKASSSHSSRLLGCLHAQACVNKTCSMGTQQPGGTDATLTALGDVCACAGFVW